LGLKRIKPDFILTPRQSRHYLKFYREYEYYSEKLNARVELACWLDGVSDEEGPWSSPQFFTMAGVEIATVSPEINIPYLFQHASRHGWRRLFWLADVAQLLKPSAAYPDWSAVFVSRL